MLSYEMLAQLAAHRFRDLVAEAEQARLARDARARPAAHSRLHLATRLAAECWRRARAMLDPQRLRRVWLRVRSPARAV
jgi:hypothetical protein